MKKIAFLLFLFVLFYPVQAKSGFLLGYMMGQSSSSDGSKKENTAVKYAPADADGVISVHKMHFNKCYKRKNGKIAGVGYVGDCVEYKNAQDSLRQWLDEEAGTNARCIKIFNDNGIYHIFYVLEKK